MPRLPAVPRDRSGIVGWVDEHLGHLSSDTVAASDIRGGQQAADIALATLDLTGYASQRSTVLPVERRGATQLSPYIRHGLLPLPEVWAAAKDAPPRDRKRFRDELLWQEYARHVYARVGRAHREPLRFGPPPAAPVRGDEPWQEWPWPAAMACMETTGRELVEDGWLVNQTRMWMASQWAVRAGRDWRDGAQEMYRHLLDGSVAANWLGWQWTVGTATGKVYGFSRWQVEKRAPQLCRSCPLASACPIQGWPAADAGPRVEPPEGMAGGPTDAGPEEPEITGVVDAVWLTAESLGTEDPALVAHPDVPAVFVFDEPLLARLQLSGKRLVFLAEALAELDAEVHLGDPRSELAGRRLATTWTYVPGWKARRAALEVTALHPWPWLRRPGHGSLRSYSAWVR